MSEGGREGRGKKEKEREGGKQWVVQCIHISDDLPVP